MATVSTEISKYMGNAVKLVDIWGSILFNVKAYGAKGDGVTDDTASIQEAINAATLVKGCVYYPPGTYLYTHLTVSGSGLTFQGSGNYCSVLEQTSSSGYGFDIFNSSGRQQNIRFRDLMFNATDKLSGTAIKFLNYINCTVENCYFKNQYDAINFSTYNNCQVRGCVFEEIKGSAIYLEFGNGVFIDNTVIGNSTMIAESTGIHAYKASGLYITNTDITHLNYALLIDPPVGNVVAYVFLTNLSCDTCKYGLYANGSLGAVMSINSTNSWYTSNELEGITLVNVDGFSCSNDRVFSNGSVGIYIQSQCKNIDIQNSVIGANNVGNLFTYGAGVFLEGGTSRFKIIGNTIVNDYIGAAVKNQMYGIYIASGVSENFLIQGNEILANLTAPMFNGSISSNFRIDGNFTDRPNAIVSGSDINIPPDGDFFVITGTTNILNGNTSWKGRKITFLFQGALTISSGFNFVIKGGGSFAAVANSVLELVCDGSKWIEISRS